MSKSRYPQIGKIGLDLSAAQASVTPIEGRDFPVGIEHLDLSWFENAITVESVAACRNELDLIRLQNDAQWILELRRLKEKAMEA